MAQGLWLDKLYLYLLTLGTGDHLVCQEMLACSSTPKPNVEDYEGRRGLSPPAAYPSTVGHKANDGSVQPRHLVYAIDYYASVVQGYPSLSGALYQSIRYESERQSHKQIRAKLGEGHRQFWCWARPSSSSSTAYEYDGTQREISPQKLACRGYARRGVRRSLHVWG